MKTISTLLTSLLFSAAVFATGTRTQSTITIKGISKSEIQVVVDGKTFRPGNNIVMISDVNPGYHSVAVYRQRRFGFNNADFEQVYSGSVAVKPAMDVQITIGRRGKTDIAYMRKERRIDDWVYENPASPNPGYGNDHGRWEDNKNYNGYANVISDRAFSQVMNSMQKEWFENNRMKSASYIISTNLFTAEQVKDMISIFSSEANKLELAKQAYTNTVDKGNYRCVIDALGYRSSKDDLARFIRDCE